MVDVDSPADWPPAGYTEGVKVSNGRKIKFYTHVETGKKFYSKKEVTRYMNSKDVCNGVTLVNCEDNSCSEKNVGQLNNQEKSCSKNNVSQVNYQDKSSTENNASQIVEETKISHEQLPPGWIVELKTRKSGSHAGSAYKVYINPSTGNKFYSMPEVSRYLKTMKLENSVGEQGTAEVSSSNQKASENSKDIGGQRRMSKRQKSNIDESAVKNISPNGIKEGSLSKQITSQDSVEEEPSCISKRQKSGNNRASSKTSPSGTGKDISNEKASQDSKENRTRTPLSKRKTRGTDSPSAKTVCSVAVDYDSADELPPGWKTEVVTRKNDRGIAKDPLYTDPVHGYVFRSKKEVFRYLQTGDTSRCARRSSKRNAASTEQDNSTIEDASLKKSECFVTGRQLFASEDSKGGKSFVTCSPAQLETSKKQPDGSVTDPNTIITSILAEINENHSSENINEGAEIGLAEATESVGVKRISPVSTPQLGLLTEKHLPGNEQEKHSFLSVTEQSLKSRKTNSRKPGFRASKRLAGRSQEVAAHLDLGEHALPAVVEKSATLSLPLKVSGPEVLQQSVTTVESGNCSQASLGGAASSDELPPGWKKEYKITKKANGIRKDPLYIDPVHGYVFLSKKDVFRYLESGDINSCAIRPAKRDLHATTKQSSPSTFNTSSKNLGCSETKRRPFAAEGSRGRKRSVTYPLEAESSKKQPESSGSNQNNITTSFAGDINAKHSYENVIENAEKIVDTDRKRRDSSGDTKVIAAESVDVKRVSAVSVPKSGVLSKSEQEKHVNKETMEQSKRSRNKKSLTPGHRTSKRLGGQNPEPVADLDLGERVFRAVVKKSASLGLDLNVRDQEVLAQNKDPAAETGKIDQDSLSRNASVDETSPGWEKEKIAMNKDGVVGTGNSDPASLSREASVDELPTGRTKKVLAQNKIHAIGTGISDQASLSREASVDELPPSREKEVLAQNKVPAVGTGISDQDSLSREASEDELPPGWTKEMLAQNKDPIVGAGNSHQASLSREISEDELPPGWTKEMLARSKDHIVGFGISDQACLSREASADELPPGWTKEMLVQNKYPTVGTSYSNQASLSREASVDDLPPGWTKEMLAQKRYPTVGNYYSDQASVDELPPGWTKEMLAQKRYLVVGNSYSYQASLSREAPVDELPPGWTKEMLAQSKNPTVGSGNSDQAYLSREVSVDDELPPGWIKEMRIRKNSSGTKRDPFYTDPVHGYVFRSKKDVMRYLQTGDISVCAVRPTKRHTNLTREDNSTSTHDANSNKFGFSLTGRQLFSTEESKVSDVGGKGSVNYSLDLQADSSNEQPENSVFNSKTSAPSIVADITGKGSGRYVNEDAEVRQYMEPEIRGSTGGTKSIASESVDVQQLRENAKKRHSNKGAPAQSRKIRNKKSLAPVRRVSESRSLYNPEVVADLDLGECGLPSVVKKSALSGLPLNVSGQEFPQQTDLTTGTFDPAFPSKNASSSPDDPLGVSVKCPSEGHTFKEQRAAMDLTSEKRDDVKRILQDSQPAAMPHVSGKVQLVQQEVKEGTTRELVKEEQDSWKGSLQNLQPAELAWESERFPVEYQSTSERLTAVQVSEKRNHEKMHWQDSQLAAPLQRSGGLNVAGQSLGEKQTGVNVVQVSEKRNHDKMHWQDSQLAAPLQKSGGLIVAGQSLGEKQTGVNAVQVSEKRNHDKMHWQDSQLAAPLQRSGGLNVAGQSLGEKQTGVPVTENQDDQSRRLHAQLGPYPIGDYWADPCMEFAFKTLTGALPVEDPLPYQGPSQQEFGTSYDGCFDLPVFNTSNFYMNDVPNHCAPTGEHVAKMHPPIDLMQPPIDLMQLPIDLNETFSPSGNISMPGCSSVTSQNPGLDSQAKDYQSAFQSQSWDRSSYSVTSQNPSLDTQPKDYQSVFKSQSWNKGS